ncbi:MAG: hypothetical protein QXZ12_06900, partial [Thermoplasmata archaeon]
KNIKLEVNIMKNNDEVIDKLVKKIRPTRYNLYITSYVLLWNNSVAVGHFQTVVNSKEFKKIKKDPLIDYAKFGVQRVIYVYIKYFPIYDLKNMIIKYNSEKIIEKIDTLYSYYQDQIDSINNNIELGDFEYI